MGFGCLIPTALAGEASVLFYSGFNASSDIQSFHPLERLSVKDKFYIHNGTLVLKAGTKSSFDVCLGSEDWTDYELELRFMTVLPKRKSGIDFAVRAMIEGSVDAEWLSLHLMRDSKSGKPLRWIRQYGKRYKEIMPNENGEVFNDGKWHTLIFRVEGKDFQITVDGEELYSFEDIISLKKGCIVLNVSEGARLTIDEIKVVEIR